ncbi:scabin-related ADP-ribosyltransferase [Streptomyces sp. NBC_00151]|uniref:scabin-related ADP-ribosyltransferase n=1 Tax=Streptomyces sp. NBC_00151 TaxID=2975669 RepID=UPI002DD9540B|nr:ADP-ribosyltransferase [Streptomyces sp. NBC_00151]WRZ36707.1 hypothetical protein OG915_00500 [Streptomyces sp. NBC_00151]WRZ44870.1 hypothetical protein OG915_47060 [Streptomyces sp. NBC_00151]
MAWAHAQAIMGVAGQPGWKSARADRLPPEGRLLRQIASDLYHAADDPTLRAIQQAQRSKPPQQDQAAPGEWSLHEWKQQRAWELSRITQDRHQKVEDRVARVTRRWKKFLDQAEPRTSTQRTFRPVVGEPQPGSWAYQPESSAWRFTQEVGAQDAAAASSSTQRTFRPVVGEPQPGSWAYQPESSAWRFTQEVGAQDAAAASSSTQRTFRPVVGEPQPGSWAYQPESSAWRFTQEAGSVDWADPGNERARVAWERAQAIMGGGEPGWQSARADRLPPEGQLLHQIASDLYHAADDQGAEEAQRPVTGEDSPQRAFEQYQHAMDGYHAVEDRVERVTQRWKKLLDQEKSGRMFRPVVEAPQPGGWRYQPGSSAWRFTQGVDAQGAAAASSGAGAGGRKWFYDGDRRGSGGSQPGASSSSGPWGRGAFPGLPGGGGLADGQSAPAKSASAGGHGAGVEAAPDRSWARRWEKLPDGERRDQALHEARMLVQEQGVHVPISLDGLDPYEQVPAVERLVRRVAVLLYHGNMSAARHQAANSTPHVLAEPHPAFSRTAHPPRHNDNPAQHTHNNRPGATAKTTSARDRVTESRGSLPGAGFRTAGPEHGYSTPPATTPIDRWLPQAVEALEEKATDHPFWKLWTPTDVGASDSVRIFGAENRELRLRGRSEEYPGHDPFSTVRWFTDRLGRWISNGPRWNWYTDSGTFLAVSDLRLTSLPEPRVSGPASPLPPLATAATVIGNAPADFLAGMRWRLGDEPLCWFTERPPQEVFAQGAMPKGHRFASLLEYVYHGRDDTVWMSATRNGSLTAEGLEQNPAQAGAAAGRYRWRYELRVPGGVDVNATLDFASPYPFEREIAFPGGVHPRFLHSAVDLGASRADGRPTTVMNPHFAPGNMSGDLLAAYGHIRRPVSGAPDTVDLWRERREGGQVPLDGLGLSTAEAPLEPTRREVVTAADGLTMWERQALSARLEEFAPRSGLLGGAPQPPRGFFFRNSSNPTDHGPSAPLMESAGSSGSNIWGSSTTGASSVWPTVPFPSVPATPLAITGQQLQGNPVNPYAELEWQAFPNARLFATEAAAMDYGDTFWTSHVRNLGFSARTALRHYTAEPFPGTTPTWPYTPSFQEMKALARDDAADPWTPRHFAAEVSKRYGYGDGSGSRTVDANDGSGLYEVSDSDFLQGALDATRRDIDTLSSALRSRPVPEDLVATKDVPLDYNLVPWAQSVGHVFEEASFMSTSLGPPGVTDHPVVLHLLVPRGTPALYLAGISEFPTERELLLDRGQRWRVRGVQVMGDKIHVIGEILPTHTLR